MLTTRSARLLNLDDYGLRVGNPADLAVIDAETPQQAVAELREPLAVWKRGRRTVTRPRAELHRPYLTSPIRGISTVPGAAITRFRSGARGPRSPPSLPPMTPVISSSFPPRGRASG